ncbi:uncharacterized protein LOC124885692 [Capsicum annuum]|uniref:uncharacterized protein LOC124885692 n=1 Tax=Capsicum annuum TaxID=4072 RepID=UPI001FB189D4|nr:uncharacterized protein LOC124885692 [Capsicum annuum]
MQMDLLAKHLLSDNTEMFKAVESQSTVFVGADAEANYEVSVDKSKENNPVESEKLDGFVDMLEKEDDKKEEVEFLTKKQNLSYELVDNIHHCGAVSSQSLVQKKPNPGAFTIPCIVGSIKFTKSLCDLGASINLMLLGIYKKLGYGEPTPTTMHFVMADRSVKRPVGILQDVLVKVDDFILPTDFLILDYDVDFEVPIILGSPLLATGRVLVDMKHNELKFRYSAVLLIPRISSIT